MIVGFVSLSLTSSKVEFEMKYKAREEIEASRTYSTVRFNLLSSNEVFRSKSALDVDSIFKILNDV